MTIHDKILTTASGRPVPSNDTALTAGPDGPLLVQDWQLFEKHAHFNRERIPERIVHAKGTGALGAFTLTRDISHFTKAHMFRRVGRRVPVFVRFSTVAGERGSADAERDVRGFAVKFYTEEGNFDLVGNNTPVFFIRDPYKFPDFIHSQKRDPRTNLRSHTAQWDFWSHSPEATHQITIMFSGRGQPASYRHMHGYGSHTFSFINADDELFWVKFHFKSQQGIRNLPRTESLIGQDRESHQRDLVNAIDAGRFPRWDVMVQVMPADDARNTPFDPFDVTKVWPQGHYPPMKIGELELNRVPENYHATVEQAAFSPANTVPGIGHSPDKMLQFRIFAYADAQRYRLGANYGRLPVNAPVCPVHCHQRDGLMRFDDNGGSCANYAPNSFGGPKPEPSVQEPPFKVSGDGARYDPLDHQGVDDFQQAGDLFRLMKERERKDLLDAIATAMADVPEDIQHRQIMHFTRADPAYGAGIANRLGLV